MKHRAAWIVTFTASTTVVLAFCAVFGVHLGDDIALTGLRKPGIPGQGEKVSANTVIEAVPDPRASQGKPWSASDPVHQGPKGERGPRGPRGETGPPGPKGEAGAPTATLRILRGKALNSCESDETLISAYCVSSASEIKSNPFIIPPRGARCVGMLNPTVVITCAKLREAQVERTE